MIGCIYHNADWDGKCSAAIICKFFGKDNVCLQGVNYGDTVDVSKFSRFNEVFVVDFSFDGMENINNLVWIDHHKTAIDKYSKGIKGVRKIGIGACALVWKYLYKSKLPKVVKYMAEYDVWNFSDKNTKYIHYAFNTYTEFNYKWFSSGWLYWKYMALVGKKIYSYCAIQDEIFFNSNSYIVGNITWCNSGRPLICDYTTEYLVTYVFDGKIFKNSIRTKTPGSDASAIAVRMGGGGHKQAAGWMSKYGNFNIDKGQQQDSNIIRVS